MTTPKIIASYALILLFTLSCRKINLQPENIRYIPNNHPQIAENLGTPLIGTNLMPYIYPNAIGQKPLITYNPNSNQGYMLVMIDQGKLQEATPKAAFKFVVVNLLTQQTKIIPIVNPNSKEEVFESVGRITRTIFGADGNLYVATEAAAGGGGHLIQYNPNELKAYDLGKPIYANGMFHDIYSLNVGVDGVLYGGSFGGNGLYSFRYENGKFVIDQQAFTFDANYLSYISGDETYTYAVVGNNSWTLYAKEKATGKITQLIHNLNADARIALVTYKHAAYATSEGRWYKLQGDKIDALPAGNRVMDEDVDFTPYASTKVCNNLIWDDASKNLTYQINQSTVQLKLNQIEEDDYETGSIVLFQDQLLIGSMKQKTVATYHPQNGFATAGKTNFGIYALCANKNKLLVAGYPKGSFAEYELSKPMSFQPLIHNKPNSFYQLQDKDEEGLFGPMVAADVTVNQNGYIIAAGNNDRLTESGSRELAISVIKNHKKHNYSGKMFQDVEYVDMSLDASNQKIWIAAAAKNGQYKLIYFDANQMQVERIIELQSPIQFNTIQLIGKYLVGAGKNKIYWLNTETGLIELNYTIPNAGEVFDITLDAQQNIWIVYNNAYYQYELAVLKMNWSNNISAQFHPFAIVQEKGDNGKPREIFMYKNPLTQKTDAIITGFKSVYRIANCL